MSGNSKDTTVLNNYSNSLVQSNKDTINTMNLLMDNEFDNLDLGALSNHNLNSLKSENTETANGGGGSNGYMARFQKKAKVTSKQDVNLRIPGGFTNGVLGFQVPKFENKDDKENIHTNFADQFYGKKFEESSSHKKSEKGQTVFGENSLVESHLKPVGTAGNDSYIMRSISPNRNSQIKKETQGSHTKNNSGGGGGLGYTGSRGKLNSRSNSPNVVPNFNRNINGFMGYPEKPKVQAQVQVQEDVSQKSVFQYLKDRAHDDVFQSRQSRQK